MEARTSSPSCCRKGKYDPTVSYLRKLGIYSYRADFLPKFLEMPASNLQQSEDLEQNKVIEAGFKIKVTYTTLVIREESLLDCPLKVPGQ